MRPALFAAAIAGLLFAACGGNVVVDTGASASAGPGAGGATTGSTQAGGTQGGAGGTGGGIGCDEAEPDGLPVAYKACSTDGDCTTAELVDCCTTYVVGEAVDAVPGVVAYLQACFHPTVCPCPPGGGETITEDHVMTSPGGYAVQCAAGLCYTYTPP